MINGEMYFVDPGTDEKIKIDGIKDFKVNNDTIPEYNFSAELNKEYNFEIDTNKISKKELLKLICNTSILTGSIGEISEQLIYEALSNKIRWVDLKQNKVHKKKRINKKWAKQYGYTCVVYSE